MKIGFYPGCSLEGSSREYAESLRAIAPALGIELEELEEWSCCGASSAHALNHTLAAALPARILAQAEHQHLEELLVPCAACYSRLISAKDALAKDLALRKEVAASFTLPYTGATAVRNILDVLTQAITPAVASKLPSTFSHKVACYYGCLLVRPPSITHESRYEDPTAMDDLMKKIGATPLAWGMKTECCGAALSITRTDMVGELCGRILDDAVSRGAEAIIVACPMCHSNLDMRRAATEKETGKDFGIPILYVTQAIGIALGMDPEQLGLQRHFVHVAVRGKAKG